MNNSSIYKIKSSQNIRLDDDISRQTQNSQLHQSNQQQFVPQQMQASPAFYN